MTRGERVRLREQAVENVDRRRGYTLEFAPSRSQHALEYDEEEERLIYNAPTPPGVTLWVKLEDVEDALTNTISNSKVIATLKRNAEARSTHDLESACDFLDLVDHGGRWTVHNPSRDPWTNAERLPVAEMIMARATALGWKRSCLSG